MQVNGGQRLQVHAVLGSLAHGFFQVTIVEVWQAGFEVFDVGVLTEQDICIEIRA